MNHTTFAMSEGLAKSMSVIRRHSASRSIWFGRLGISATDIDSSSLTSSVHFGVLSIQLSASAGVPETASPAWSDDEGGVDFTRLPEDDPLLKALGATFTTDLPTAPGDEVWC